MCASEVHPKQQTVVLELLGDRLFYYFAAASVEFIDEADNVGMICADKFQACLSHSAKGA